MYEQTKWCLDQLDEINSELPSSFSEQVYTNLGKARKELEASPPNEKDEYIKLQEQYRLSLKTATYFRKGDTATVKWSNIDNVTYDFFFTLENDGGDSPFSAPIKIKTNINNGLGVRLFGV